MMKRLIASLLALALALSACGDSVDPIASTSGDEPQPSVTTRPTGVDAKLTSHLFAARLLAADGATTEEIAARVPELQFADDAVLVEVTVSDVSAEVIQALTAAGMDISGEYPDLQLITGAATAGSLRGLADIDAVTSIAPAFGATTR